MPTRKHWFPVSHDINSDPEVRELTDTFGEWLLLAWLQILSVTDRNDGEWMGDPKSIAARLSELSSGLRRDKDVVRRRWKGTGAAERAEIALYWMCLKNWLLPIYLNNDDQMVIESWPNRARMVAEWYANGPRIVVEWSMNGHRIVGFKVRNHWKYHKTQGREKTNTDSLLSYPNQSDPDPIIKEAEPAEPAPVDNYDSRIKEVIKAVYLADHAMAKEVASWAGVQKQCGNSKKVICLTCERFWKRVQDGLNPSNVRGYLTQLEKNLYTEDQQGDSKQYKNSDMSKVSAILGKMGVK